MTTLIAEPPGRQGPGPMQASLVEALDLIGATYEYITYPNEGHGFLSRDAQLHFYRRLERFLDWHLM